MTHNSQLTTPVTILTGFLGAGKTTLLNRILRGNHGLRIGVLVNDFGAVNIDARLVDSVADGGQAINLSNGCICCSMQGDLVTSTLKMLSRPDPPEQIVIEASGISDPFGVASAFRTSQLRERTRLDGVVALVDAENAHSPYLDRQLVEDQIRAADIVLLNKADLVDAARLEELREWVRELVPRARVLTVVQADIPLEVLLGVGGASAASSHDHGPHEIARFSTITYETECRLAYRKVQAALESLPPEVFRAKGTLYLADAPNLRFVAQLVGRRVTIDVDRPWGEEEPRTQLVVIGAPGSISGPELDARIDACSTDAFPIMADGAFQRLRGRAQGRAELSARP
jgi:G3E family GTPase